MKTILIIMTLWISSYSITVTDISNNPGILHYTINNAKLIETYYKTYHFYNITLLYKELIDIQNNLPTSKTPNNVQIIIQDLLKQTKAKTKIIFQHNRVKRGLINGIGTALSWLTGTMTADDKEYYDKVIKEVEQNNFKVEHNIEKGYKLNKRIIDQFQQDIKIINKDFTKEQNEITEVEKEIKLQQLYIQLNHVYTKINDLTLTLELCRLGIVHTTIITEILKDIHPNVTLISSNLEVLWLTSKIHCTSHGDTLHIFVDLPLANPKINTYMLIPAPVWHKLYYVTLNMTKTLVIKKNNQLFNTKCKYIINQHYCTLLDIIKEECILNIINRGITNDCTYKKTNPQTMYIDEIDKYVTTNISTLENCETNQIVYLPPISLIGIKDTECFKGLPKIHKNVIDSTLNLLYTTRSNITIEQVKTLNVKQEDLEQITFTTTDKHIYPIIISSVSGIIILTLSLYLWKKKKTTSATAPVLYQLAQPETLVLPTSMKHNLLNSPYAPAAIHIPS